MTAYDTDVLFREDRAPLSEGPTLVDHIDQQLLRYARDNRALRAQLRRRRVIDFALVLAAAVTAAACAVLT